MADDTTEDNPTIPFSRSTSFGDELQNIQQAMANQHLSGDGAFTEHCEKIIEERLGAPKVFLTHSCSAALELAARLLELGPGDEVIVPSFTFSSTANAIALTGATPVFADCESTTMNIDVDKIEALITPQTKAIFVVHYAGLVPDMERISAIADQHNLKVVEDAAQSLGSTYRGEPAGTHSSLSTISFHETKNIISGQGGALVVNDETLIPRAAILREKGTNRRAFMDGKVDKYTWVDIGCSHLPSEITAAFLAPHLARIDEINNRRLEICERYLQALSKFEGPQLQWCRQHSANSQANGHIFFGLFDTAQNRSSFLTSMARQNIKAVFHYIPLHSAPAGIKFGKAPDGCPVTEDASARLVRLPLYFDMSDKEVDRVIEAAKIAIQELSA